MRWNGLTLFLNRNCPVGCDTCSAGCRPDLQTRELSSSWLEKFFKRVEHLPFDGYVLWTGGEPFGSFESLKTGISLAAAAGYRSEILTSGIWFIQHPEYLDELPRQAGCRLRLSLDGEHSKAFPLDQAQKLIDTALDSGVDMNFTLRDVPSPGLTPEDYVRFIKEHFATWQERRKNDSRWIHRLPTIPLHEWPRDVPSRSRSSDWRGPCPVKFKDVVIGEDGFVYPCCGLFSVPGHERVRVGNPLKDPWEEIYNRMNASVFLSTLRDRGPYGIGQELGFVPEWNERAWQGPCHLCQALFRRTGIWSDIETRFQN